MPQQKLRATNYGLLCIALLLILASYQFAYAQDDIPTDDEVNEIAKGLYCPVCENTPLDVCPTEACKQWREVIRTQLAQGKTKEEIEQYFVDYYGDRVLAEPPRTGLNWLVYILPPAVILLGAVLLFKNFQAWTKPKKTESNSNQERSDALSSSKGDVSSSDKYISQIEEELKKRK
ncbi:MAG: cytochrome c-type biogenesis protein CcmH [Anaerolineales bacterium]